MLKDMKGGERMTAVRMIVSRELLDACMDRAGISNYEKLSEATKDTENYVSRRTIYEMIDSDKWSSKNVHSLAEAMHCNPNEFVVLRMMMPHDDAGKALAPVAADFVYA